MRALWRISRQSCGQGTWGPLSPSRACSSPADTHKQCTTVLPSPLSFCHLSTWARRCRKDFLESGVSRYADQRRYWKCRTIRCPSCNWKSKTHQLGPMGCLHLPPLEVGWRAGGLCHARAEEEERKTLSCCFHTDGSAPSSNSHWFHHPILPRRSPTDVVYLTPQHLGLSVYPPKPAPRPLSLPRASPSHPSLCTLKIHGMWLSCSL